MKRKANKKKSKAKAQPKKRLSQKAKRWIVAGSTAFGIIAGCLFWFFISRCMHDHCFFHYWPLKEVLVSGTFFAIAPFIFLNEDIGKTYRYNRKTK